MERERNTFFLSLDADTDTYHRFIVTCVAVSFSHRSRIQARFKWRFPTWCSSFKIIMVLSFFSLYQMSPNDSSRYCYCDLIKGQKGMLYYWQKSEKNVFSPFQKIWYIWILAGKTRDINMSLVVIVWGFFQEIFTNEKISYSYSDFFLIP